MDSLEHKHWTQGVEDVHEYIKEKGKMKKEICERCRKSGMEFFVEVGETLCKYCLGGEEGC